MCLTVWKWSDESRHPGLFHTGADLGGGCRGCAPSPEMTCGFLIQLVFCKKKTMWFIGVEVEQETSAPPPKKNPGSAPGTHAWKPLSRLFSRPDWLPLGLRGWQSVWNVSKLGDRLHDEFQCGLPSWGFSHQFATSFSRAWKMKCSAIFVPEENTRDKEIYFSVLKKGNYRHSFRTLIVD